MSSTGGGPGAEAKATGHRRRAPHRSSSWRAGTLLFALAAVVLLGIGAVLAAAHPEWSLRALVGDDAGYYFTIARNHALGHGFSYDRLHETNGFNPLFPWILIAAFQALPSGLPLTACYRVGVLIGFGAMVVALVAWLRILAAAVDPRVFPGDLRHLVRGAAAAFFVLFVATKGYYGMDAPLVLALGLLYAWRVVRGGPLAPGPRAAVADGLLLALAFLARVDTLPLVAAAFAVMACEWAARRSGGRALAARLAVTVAACLPYLLWSTARFGTWLPVSARLKSSFPVPDPAASLTVIRGTSLNLVDQASFLVAWLLALGVAVVLARHVGRAWRARTPLDPMIAALGVLALYLIGRLTYMALFSRADVQGSYAILAHVFNVLVGVRLVTALASRAGAEPLRLARRVAALAAGVLAVLALLLFAGKVRTTATGWRESSRLGFVDELRLGREIHALTGERDILYGGTFGILGFFADRSWINLDGVVNTYAYQQVFIEPGSRGEGGLADYLAANHVSHVVFIVPRGTTLGPGPIRLSAWGILHDRRNEFVVSPDDLLLRRPVARGPAGGGDLYVVRYRP